MTNIYAFPQGAQDRSGNQKSAPEQVAEIEDDWDWLFSAYEMTPAERYAMEYACWFDRWATDHPEEAQSFMDPKG